MQPANCDVMGGFELAIKSSCCAMLASKHPNTHSKLKKKKSTKKLDKVKHPPNLVLI